MLQRCIAALKQKKSSFGDCFNKSDRRYLDHFLAAVMKYLLVSLQPSCQSDNFEHFSLQAILLLFSILSGTPILHRAGVCTGE